MARTKQPARGRTKEDAATKVDDAELVGTEQGAPIETEEEVRAEDEASVAAESEVLAEIEDEAPAEAEALVVAEEAGALASVEDIVPASPEAVAAQVEPVTLSTTGHATSFHTIVGEVTDYSQRSLENGSAFVKKLLGAKSLESAILIQSEYAKTSYVDFVVHLTKIGTLYSKLATEILERRSRIS